MAVGTKKINLVIFMMINVANGRGVPQFVLNFINFIPREKFNITLVQSDFTDIERLDRNDYEQILKSIRVITFRDVVSKFNFLMKSSITQIFLYAFIKPFVMRINKYMLNRETKEALRQADIVYLTSNYYASMVWKNIKLVGSCHTFYTRNGTLGKIYGQLTKIGILNRFPLIHVFPGYEHFFENKNRSICVTPLPINCSRFLPSETAASGKVKLLFVGGLDKSKGLDILLDAFENLNKQKFELHIAGRGEMENLVSGRENENIIYHGKLSQLDLEKLYRSCDIFVSPTRSDTYSTVVLEALSSGLYVIVSDMLSGIFDVYQKNGFLTYCRNDPKEFQKMIDLCSSRILTPDEKMKLHEMVCRYHDPERIFGDLASCLSNFHHKVESTTSVKKFN